MKIWKYAEEHTSEASGLLKEIERETHVNFLYSRMISGNIQGRILSLLSRLIQPSTILEIGTFTGYSAICLAEGLKENGEIHTIEINSELEDAIRNNFKLAGLEARIHLYLGNAIDIIPGLDFSYDMVFIDADKINYISYYEMVLQRLSSRGLILADNVLWNGKVVSGYEKDKEALKLREFNEYVQNDKRVENILLPVRDGIMLIKKV